MGIAWRAGAPRLRPGPREPALREARVCYDHLAGEQGVRLLDGLAARGLVQRGEGGVTLSASGIDFLGEFGVDVALLTAGRRPLCRTCLDWSERRHHLGGAVGAAILQRFLALGWARRLKDSRAVQFTPVGLQQLQRRFGWPEPAETAVTSE